MYQTEFLAVLASTILSIVLGFFWYSPVLFGEYWMKQMGYTSKSIKESAGKMGRGYLLMTVGTILTFSIYSYIRNQMDIEDMGRSILLAVLVWLGFELPILLNGFIFGNKKIGAVLVEAGHQLAALILSAGIFVLL